MRFTVRAARLPIRLLATSTVLLACASDREVPPVEPPRPGTPLGAPGHGEFVTGFPEGVTITTALVKGDPRSAAITVRSETSICWSRTLTPNDGAVSVISACDGHDVSLDLQFVSPDGPCRDGSLTIVRGTFRGRGRGVAINDYELAAWSADGSSDAEKLTRAPTPDARPLLDSAASAREWTPVAPLSEVGRWAYSATLGSIAPAPGCAVVTNVNLTLQPLVSGRASRTFVYRVEQRRAKDAAGGDVLASTATARDADAPTLVVAPATAPPKGQATRARFTVGRLEIVTAADASLSAAYEMPSQVASPPRTDLQPVGPALEHVEEIRMTSSPTPQPLAAHLASFFGTLTAPGASPSAPAGTAMTVSLALTVSLATPVAGGFPVTRPIATIAAFDFAVGADARADCAAQTTKSFVCALATTIEAASGAPQPAANSSYVFEVSLLGRVPGEAGRPLHLVDLRLPLALVSP